MFGGICQDLLLLLIWHWSSDGWVSGHDRGSAHSLHYSITPLTPAAAPHLGQVFNDKITRPPSAPAFSTLYSTLVSIWSLYVHNIAQSAFFLAKFWCSQLAVLWLTVDWWIVRDQGPAAAAVSPSQLCSAPVSSCNLSSWKRRSIQRFVISYYRFHI